MFKEILSDVKGKYLVGLGLFVLAVSLFSVFGDKGLVDAYRLSKERDNILGESRAIEDENKRMGEEIALLRNDRRAIEMVARQELGMIAKDEVIYRIED